MKLAIDLNKIQNVGIPTLTLRSGGRTDDGIGRLLTIVLPYLYSGAAILLLIYLVSGGLQMMFAKGDPKALQSAQGKITTSLIGFIIIIFAYFITRLIGQVFGIEAIEEIFK